MMRLGMNKSSEMFLTEVLTTHRCSVTAWTQSLSFTYC